MAEATNLSFEAALERLEEIVRLLENGQLALEDSISAYEEGMRLARYCLTQLRAAELRIQELSVDGKDVLE
ncbi:exodeoxyribonuclease VII small subunit [Rhodothermus bifroesti]|jgi:exodeoxyribonuclease VII small subunit|uniref:Exodeoxyribonuclease 7 small subunit n=1 Tax=Rhodothermus marinus TaxID=29549 RepID=A0A7V2AZ35_RHOMR|nr:exodeoxyribonuclease VII small subunit [Rhodothermus bifroesti]GBD00860.1 Exodeoxyribonuclease 7 small subunit [bacterium HR18]